MLGQGIARFGIGLAVGAAVFAMLLATLGWNIAGFGLAGMLGILAGYGFWRWNDRLLKLEMNPAARERAAMGAAWRRGGRISAAELSSLVGLSAATAQETLEALAKRGVCRPEGEEYIF
jgi:xanthosine utilization system XapX-like protein